MLLVAGGQLDINIGLVLRRLLARGDRFCDLLVGPELTPTIRFAPDDRSIEINGQLVSPTACLIRHDVFLTDRKRAGSAAIALNWFHAIRGWAHAHPAVRLFNRSGLGSENNKVANLAMATRCGLKTPTTVVTNDLSGEAPVGDAIMKPVAGGQYTKLLPATDGDVDPWDHPWFVQLRLIRPEVRLYRVGDRLFGFEVVSDQLDYREDKAVRVRPYTVPDALEAGFIRLCDALGLDFAAADFMQDKDGDFVFLEVNTQPMFAAFDRAVEGRLIDAMIDALIGTS